MTLNEEKGKQISDLEALLILINKLIDDKIYQKPKAGIILAKGKPNERRFRFTEAKKTMSKMEGYFGFKGCISIGVCETCTCFDQGGSSTKVFGVCTKKARETRHCWDTCPEHSKEGGGYGV